MERRVRFEERQQLTTTDANNLGNFPREALDHVVEDMGPGWGFSGFAGVISAASIVNIGAGRLYAPDGKVYFNADAGGTALDFQANLPVTGKRISAVVAFGSEIETLSQPRTFITDATTRATESRVVATQHIRHANIQTVHGIEGPDPQRPTVPSNYLVLAWVTLDPTGVESVVAEEANRVRGLDEHDVSIETLNTWKNLFGQRLDTLATELANLAGRLGNLTNLDTFLRLVVDVTRLKEKADLPDNQSQWGSDYFLDDTESDTGNVDYLARIEEGIRFSHAAERVAALQLSSPIDASVRPTGNLILPKYHEVRRLANVATAQTKSYVLPYTTYAEHHNHWHRIVAYRTIFVQTSPQEISISQFANQVFAYRRRYPVRWRVRWGAPYYWSSRINFWWDRRHDPVYWTFKRRGSDAAFVILPGPPFNPYPVPSRWSWRYSWKRTKWWWHDRIVDYHYWERVYTSHSVNGSVVAQTFLNSQDGWLTGVTLFFTRKGTAGNITVLLCETYENGQPNPEAVIAESSALIPGDINLWPFSTRVWFPPSLLQQGKRYAYMFITQGNHYLATTERNQMTNGTMFYSTDSAWFQGFGDMSRDVAFENIFAEFENTRTEVLLEPAELSGGIAAIDINTEASEPEGTTLTFEGLIDGEWVPMSDPGPDAADPPFNGLPALTQLRAVFQGTTALQPSLSLGNASEVYTWRGRSDFRHISEARTVPVAVDSIVVTARLEAWRGAPFHTCTMTVRHGAGYTTVVSAAAVSDTVAPDDPDAIIRKATFTVVDLTSYKIVIEGTTDNVLTPFHVAERIDIALTV